MKKKSNSRKIVISALAVVLVTALGFSIAFANSKPSHAVESSSTIETTASDVVETSTTPEINLIKKITLNHSSLTLTKGKKSVLKAKVTYDGDSFDTNEDYVWSSKNKSVATISKNGKVVAVKAGKTYIICSSQSGNVKVRCKITVRNPYNPVKTIKLDKDQMRLNKKDKRVLKPIITYGDKKKKKYAHEELIWRSSNNKVATVNKNGKVTWKSNGTAYIKATSKYTNKSVKCKVFVQNTKYIAITFDDGPGEYTNTLLDALEKYHSKATFFVLGNRAAAYSSQLKRENNLGMEIGSHTYSHKNLKAIPKKEVISEINNTKKAVKDVIGVEPSLLRPPYGNYNATVSKHAGVPMIYWSVDTEDWKYKNASYVKRTVLNFASDGQIVLLHDIHQTTVQGFIKALPSLRKQGYELVTVSELYAIKGKTLKKGVMYYGPYRDNN